MKPPRIPTRLRWLLATLLLVGVVAVVFHLTRPRPAARALRAAQQLLPELLALEAREAEAFARHWGPEVEAQRCGRVFEALWDAVNRSSNRLEVIGSLGFQELLLPSFEPVQELGHGIRWWRVPSTLLATNRAEAEPLSPAAWRERLRAWQQEGWQLTQLEFRHNGFALDGEGQPGRSQFGFRAHAFRPGPEERAGFEGTIEVTWSPAATPEAEPAVRRLDARGVSLKTRAGPPAFRRILREVVHPPEKSHFIDPLLVRDLDGDGRPEIILAAANRVYRLGAAGGFEWTALCATPPSRMFTALLANFDREPGADLLAVTPDGLALVSGSPEGRLSGPPRTAWSAPQRIRYGQTLTCGDVDGDGDLDVWLGQYKNPYDGGQMPTPYYDAQDGNPAYLLLNDGQGHFTDATEPSGLAAHRFRRTYAASLVDLDDDGDLDLVVVSDFGGVELYANDGRGRFTDVTRQRIARPSGFGMALCVADFNRDAWLDLFVTGMHCPTASRLVQLGLSRPERPDYVAHAPAMTMGNKLLLADGPGAFLDVAPDVGVARSGWSWGCAAADFDNDGWPDLAVANGHETRASVREYEPEFWLHDLYVADSKENPVVATYFASKFHELRGSAGWSYGGWEQNRLFLNRGPAGFVEVAHLLGVALGEDSRNLVAEDLDGDGRVDLVLTTFEVWPEARQTLQVFRNELPDAAHWLEVRLRDRRGIGEPVGAKVTLRLKDGAALARAVIAGDSHRCQAGGTLHFGLGAADEAGSVEVRWPDGERTVVPHPKANQVMEVNSPGR